jgi:DNA-binding IclR family transcriptional regulator
MKGASRRKYTTPLLEKGLDVLEVLARCEEPQTFNQLAAALNRSRGELFRVMLALERRGYVEALRPGSGFVAAPKLFTLGLTQAPTKALIDAALPPMRRLVRRTHQSCYLAIPHERQMTVIARVEAPGDCGFSVRVGAQRPLLGASSGVAIFAALPERARALWLARLADHSAGQSVETFLRRAERARLTGYACVKSDLVEGVVDLAVAVNQNAAIAIPYIRSRPSPCSRKQVGDCLCAAGADIAEALAAARPSDKGGVSRDQKAELPWA